ncbi:hypothetical protein JYU34_021276 [Plutella xylostella]|uniref:Uncharacterized protein n=1 Tax=Plutella xylostella TaxID=51655 RepID=A0ABQ7PUQ7_PLUXY|nr:hypothetical protein JYU34_021276 [Plutella xylostella]
MSDQKLHGASSPTIFPFHPLTCAIPADPDPQPLGPARRRFVLEDASVILSGHQELS